MFVLYYTGSVFVLLFNLLLNFKQAPGYHIAIEVILCLFIIYLVFFKKIKSDFKPLSKKEKQQLLDEWRPEPLVPPFQETLKNAVKYRSVSGLVFSIN